MSKPKVSIVLPVYNGEKYLSAAVDSILGQTYSNWELIVINDCSTDNTERIVNEYIAKDGRIRIYNNDKNLKLPNSLNAGFMRATGDFYTWTSDDNILMPHMLENLVDVLEKDNDIGMVYSNFKDINENGEISKEWELQDPEGLLYENVCGASFLYRREVAYQIGGYDPALFLAEDYDYWLRIWAKYSIFHLRESLYLYRRHDQSLTATRYNAVIQQTYKAMMKNIQFLLAKLTTRDEYFAFFDHLLEMASKEDKEKIYFFLNETKNYRIYRNRKDLKNKYIFFKDKLLKMMIRREHYNEKANSISK